MREEPRRLITSSTLLVCHSSLARSGSNKSDNNTTAHVHIKIPYLLRLHSLSWRDWSFGYSLQCPSTLKHISKTLITVQPSTLHCAILNGQHGGGIDGTASGPNGADAHGFSRDATLHGRSGLGCRLFIVNPVDALRVRMLDVGISHGERIE